MADFVREHVGLGEVTGSAEALVQLVKELEIEVYLAIAGAIERANGCLGEPASRLDGVAEEHGPGPLVPIAEQLLPGDLRVFHHRVHEVDHLLFFRSGRYCSGRARGFLVGGLRSTAADKRQEVDASEP